MRHLLLFLSIVFFISSCADSQQCEYVVDISQVQTSVKINRLEKSLFESKSPEDVRKILNQYPMVAHKYFGITVQDSQSLIQGIYGFYTNKDAKEFYLQGERINDQFPGLESSVTDLFKHIKYYFPNYQPPQVNTLVTGFANQDLLVDDSLVVISMDFFYGKKAKFRPNEYEYMLVRRTPENIVPTVASQIALETFVDFDPADQTMLADMIKWGKVHYFQDRVMPCVPDSIIIGYASAQLEGVEQNITMIWDHFISQQLFYKTDKHEIQRYVGEAPKVPVIAESCPGRIGRYLGWQIVKAYMDRNPKVTLKELMEEKDAQKIFKLSKYKPKVK